ncbi:MAG: R3H domain-containing nucleic acid-binding protein [Candidatus Moranbacteria bacterium]|nr:R3H domain-containing nucleic acid-binding protein [Candidatus Moranbacteria bacterium]
MTKPENTEMIKGLIDETLKKMSFDDFILGVREETGSDGENLIFNIETKDSDLLIGQYGANLRSLQHILRAIARKKTEEKMRFSIDVNDYLKQKIGSLEDLAQNLARQAVVEKRPVVLRPMNAYERRVVHLALSGNNQIRTESIGEGEERKVVIRPVENIEQENTSETL